MTFTGNNREGDDSDGGIKRGEERERRMDKQFTQKQIPLAPLGGWSLNKGERQSYPHSIPQCVGSTLVQCGEESISLECFFCSLKGFVILRLLTPR